MKLIPLTQGQFAKVDDEDFERLNAHKWRAEWMPRSQSFRAIRNLPRKPGTKRQVIKMHREIMNAQPHEIVDHRFHDTLDNRKDQLRKCSKAQNGMNDRLRRNSTSGFKGVTWDNANTKWMAHISTGRRFINLGRFTLAKDAAVAYDLKALELFGEFALTNAMLGLL